MNKIKKLEDLYEKSRELSIEIIEELARDILRNNKDLDEFIMAMGSYFFTYKNKKETLSTIEQKMNKNYKYDYIDSKKFLKPLNNFISTWDDTFKMTGISMRFTEKGEIITDW